MTHIAMIPEQRRMPPARWDDLETPALSIPGRIDTVQ